MESYEAEVAFRTLNNKSEIAPFTVEGYGPCAILFPILINKYLTGSRAEFLYRDNSDYDYLYEVGPGLVRDFRDKQDNDDHFEGFYWKQTENVGFYTIEDKNGMFLYSQIVQQKLAPLFLTGQDAHQNNQYDFEQTSKTSAAISYSNKDLVIGLRLEKWPIELLEAFPIKEAIDNLKKIPLFLIAKSFPGSPLAKLEWRISFSLVELEMLIRLPSYQRKAFLRLKHSLKNVEELPSYFLKTSLMVVTSSFKEEHLSNDELKVQSFYNEVWNHLEKSIAEERLPNLFVPEQNLCLLVERKELEKIKLNCLKSQGNLEDQCSQVSVTVKDGPEEENKSVNEYLAAFYFKIIRIVYQMVNWKERVKDICEMMPHKYADKLRDPFYDLRRINSKFDDTQISEYEFLAYITDLNVLIMDDWYMADNYGKYLKIGCNCSYFSKTGSVAQKTREVKEKHEKVVEWIDKIIKQIKQDIFPAKKSLFLRKEGMYLRSLKKLLKDPGDALRDSYLRRLKRNVYRCYGILILSLFGIFVIVPLTCFLLFINIKTN